MSTHSYLQSLARRRILIGTVAALAAWGIRAEEAWPDGKTMTWVVPYPPGGSTDVLGRAIARQVDASLGTTVVVENRPGATGTIGAARVARSAPDGLTVLGTSIGPQAIAPHIMGSLPYDPVEDFAPVITVGTIPHILVVGAKQPYQSVKALVDEAKASPDHLAFASGGTGTVLHMQGELLQQQTGARFIHVPYKGDTPALQDTLGEQVQFMFAPAAAALPHIQSGTLRPLAVTSAQRLPALPNVPTMAELGFNDFVVEQWQAVFVPASTPSSTIQRLNGAIEKALQTPDLTALADKLGITLVGGTPQALDERRRADFSKWGKLIREAGIQR
ncbi:Bug family tripartite tricarboxylate transporter substrate binding protein [Pusillimonas sp. SM2304]|uniref:Bug family tripartite tricarboxylate transporter substrate binding protein n=1 Tax=Pusillimonas sp. SM2304 TaxID=3073241 RepID=UPI0038F6D5B8